MRLDYLKTIASPDLTDFLASAKPVFPNFTTVNESYERKLNRMKESLKSYIEDETLERPFLYLILGPPGAGKSYLMSKLVDQLNEKENTKQAIAFQSINISEVLDPRELHRFYENIERNNDIGIRTVSLLDEVDVKWRDGSAIKHLINPIYDGAYWDGTRFRKFGRCAFYFAGSYLQDRDTLVKTQKLLAGMDLSKFLLDLYLEMHRRNDLEALQEVKEVRDFFYTQQKWQADVDPRTDTILYLRNLEKIRDFLSRIAGNIFEMIDVSAPLHITREAFAISGERPVKPSPKLHPIEVVRFVKQQEDGLGHFISFDTPSQPLIEYKNVLLCERLLRVILQIKKRFKKLLEKDENVKAAKHFKIERTLLNYLTVVPLINGMRSLEQLVNRLYLPEEGLVRYWPESKTEAPFKAEEIAMIVHNSEEYSDPQQVWYRMARENPRLMQKNGASDNDYISIPL